MARARRDLGYTLVELLIGIALLTLIASAIYSLLVTMDRGLVLLNGQMNAQQNPRISMERMVDDIQNATYLTVSPTSTLPNTAQSLWITKATVLCAPAAAGATAIYVANGNDFQAAQNIWLSATGAGNALPAGSLKSVGGAGAFASETWEQIQVKVGATFPTGNFCSYAQEGTSPYGTMTATEVDLASGLKGSYPWGTLVWPVAVQYQTQWISGSAQLTRGQLPNSMVPLAANVSAFSASGFSSALSQNANATDMVLQVANQPNANGVGPFTIGNKVYVNPSSAPFIANVVGVTWQPPNTYTVLSLDTPVTANFSAGTFVQTLPYVTTNNAATSAGAGTITVTNSINGVSNFAAGDVITIDVIGGASLETRSVFCDPNFPGSLPQVHAATTTLTPALVSNCKTAAPLFYQHLAGVQVAKKVARIGVMDTPVDSAAGGALGGAAGAPSDTDTSESATRN